MTDRFFAKTIKISAPKSTCMHDTLLHLDHLIADMEMDIRENIRKSSTPSEASALWANSVKEVAERIKRLLVKELLTPRRDTDISLFIHNLQRSLSVLIDRLYRLHETAPSCSHLHDAQQKLVTIYTYLLQGSGPYCCLQQPLPGTCRLSYAANLRPIWESLMRRLPSDAESRGLTSLLTLLLKELLDTPGQLNLHRYTYYMNLLPVLAKTCEKYYKSKELLQSLVEELQRHNFNERGFIDFCIEWEKHNLEPEMTLLQTLEYWQDRQKKVRQWPLTKSMHALYPEQPGLREQLLHWLEEEMKCCKRMLEQENIQSVVMHPMKDDTKINLGVSVSVLACLLKSMVLCGIITNRNHSDIVRFFAAYFRTSKKENISYKSLKNRYDGPLPGSMNITKDILHELLRAVNKL